MNTTSYTRKTLAINLLHLQEQTTQTVNYLHQWQSYMSAFIYQFIYLSAGLWAKSQNNFKTNLAKTLRKDKSSASLKCARFWWWSRSTSKSRTRFSHFSPLGDTAKKFQQNYRKSYTDLAKIFGDIKKTWLNLKMIRFQWWCHLANKTRNLS